MSLEHSLDGFWVVVCDSCYLEEEVSSWDEETKDFAGAWAYFKSDGWLYQGNGQHRCRSCNEEFRGTTK
ncbi:MAG: hypothetical protein GWN01_02570 [Nitrosopumilaceae archaeon]|nr:hypothetical protein [Nitrosopumilaceae archaeon]NIU86214.1 hypothetical protein [Nitrosopumilaceae archaeon]NIX60454.1 hypothetical protein [Nitrosopumilaceae archaeon]